MFHPSTDNECSSLDFCEKGEDGVWTTIKDIESCYVNLGS